METDLEAELRRARRLLGKLADAFDNAVVLFDEEAALVEAARKEAAKAITRPAGEAGETTQTENQTETTKT